MEQEIQQLVNQLKDIFGEELLSVVLHGSYAKEELMEKRSDINLLVILNRLSLTTLGRARNILKRGQRKNNIQTLFWTIEELKNSSDVFPIEFLDIMQNRKVVYGVDPFGDISVTTENLRHQVEFELRSKLLGLRSAWISLQGNSRGLEDHLVRIGTSFLHLFERARTLKNNSFPAHLREPLEMCLKLKRREVKLRRDQLEQLYGEVHNAVSDVVKMLN